MARRSRTKSTRQFENPQYSNQNNQANVIELGSYRKAKKKKIEIIPRSVNQESYLLALEDPSKSIVIATGPAGTGKTMLGTLWAMKALQMGDFSKIVISRPNVAVDDKDIGFLPGDIFKKMAPWMMPILDVFKEYFTPQEVEEMIKMEIIEIVPIAFIRGRTFKNAVIILDEAQGTTVNSMLSVLTRIGEGSRMIVTGDVRQSDRGKDNGLQDLMDKIKTRPNLKHLAMVEFTRKDIERHPAVGEVLRIYQEE